MSCLQEDLVDAETGERINLSRARWNVTEGRLSLDTQTILMMGTGRLDVTHRVREEAAEMEREAQREAAGNRRGRGRNQKSPSKLASAGSRTLGFSAPPSPFSSPPASASASGLNPRLGSGPGFAPSTPSSLPTHSREQFPPGNPHSAFSAHPHEQPSSTPGQPQEPPRHPLVTRYLKEGPSVPMQHVYWDRRSNSVLLPQDPALLAEVREVDVSFEVEEEAEAKWGAGLAGGLEDAFDLQGEGGLEGNRDGSRDGSSYGSWDGSRDGSRKGSSNRLSFSLNLRSRKPTGQPSSPATFSPVRPPLSIQSDRAPPSSASSVSSVGSALSGLSAGLGGDGRRAEKTDQLLAPSIVPSNILAWSSMEEQVFQQVYTLGWHFELNKVLTREPPMRGGKPEVRRIARHIARKKVGLMKDIVQACADEQLRNALRIAAEQEAEAGGRLLQLADMVKVHAEERRKSRRYLQLLEQDGEVVVIRELNEIGWLW
ncbi:hypothetical protein B484DRAFT_456710 [Ochromonadaceae sp. CCMP2298]|nr:hypothetical protein B484DRAFT_456710 [Ochromonadaceae sp. CCMP2298]